VRRGFWHYKKQLFQKTTKEFFSKFYKTDSGKRLYDTLKASLSILWGLFLSEYGFERKFKVG
jgi:hypothetical protein